jgi:hypothetical protein
VTRAAIALGAVAPVVVRATAAEGFLVGKPLHTASIAEAARLAVTAAAPIDDIRSSATYRRAMIETLVARALQQIADGAARAGWPESPILLWGETGGVWPVAGRQPAQCGIASHSQRGNCARQRPQRDPGGRHDAARHVCAPLGWWASRRAAPRANAARVR